MGYFEIRDGVLERYTGREESILVPEGIHTIAEGAFKGCVSLKKVMLPTGLQRILADAFKGCRRLEEIVFPEGLAYISRYAFHRCHALRQAILPLSVKELGECAFLYCDSLREVHIPGVERLGMAALANGMSLEKLVISRELDERCICDVFTGCSRVREIAFADGESLRIPNVVDVAVGAFKVPRLIGLVVEDIVLRMMELEGRTLVRFRVNIKHVEVPEGVEVLARSSFFDMRGIVDIRLPGTLERIESRAFRNCIGLEQVILGNDRVSIDADAFRNCTSLRSVRTCDGTEYVFGGLTDIYRVDVDTAEKLRMPYEKVPEPVRSMRRQVLGNFRISGTMLLRYLGEESRVVIPEGITMIAEGAFAGNETIDRVIFPESLQRIGAEAFRGCLLMQTAELPGGLRQIAAGAFADCVKLLRIEIPEQIDVLEDRVFCNCRMLQEVRLPDGLKSIGESAFYGCAGLKRIRLPESLSRIARMAFYKSGLREIRIPSGTAYVESLAFAKSSLQKAWISGGARATGEQYGTDVFRDCTGLRMLALGEGVRHLPDRLAYGCTALERVALPQTLAFVGRHALEGSLYLERWKQQLPGTQCDVLWDGQHLEGDVQIQEDVRIIAGGAFYGNAKIVSVALPEQVRSVGTAAFKGCMALRRVSLPAHIDRTADEVFCGCGELEEVLAKRPDGQEGDHPAWYAVGARAFYQCRKLRGIRLDQAEFIGKEALRGCGALIADRVHPMLVAGEGAFAGTLIGEQTADGLHIVGNVVVSGMTCKGEICLPEGIRGIAPYAFAGDRLISSVSFPESLRWIGEGAFFGCSSLMCAVFPKAACMIAERAFEKCASLKEVESVACAVGESAFAGCASLVRAVLPQIAILEERTFYACGSLTTCQCGNAHTVQAFCFSGCRSLQAFDLAPIRHIGEYAFEGCEGLGYAAFQEGARLMAHAMEDCSGLERICLLGQGTVELGEYALSGCTSLSRVAHAGREWLFRCYGDILSEEIPETVRLLFHSAFSCFEVEREEEVTRYRGAASRVRIPFGIRKIRAEVFRDAMLLEQIEIPESVVYIGARAFHGTAWMAQERKKSPMVVVRDMLLDGSGCAGDVTIPEDIRLVCGWAFANGLDIERIQFLSDRVQVAEYAFRNCIDLREMILPDKTVIKFTGLPDRKKELPPLAAQAVADSLNCFKTDEAGVLMECTGNISRLRLACGITKIGEGAFQDGNLLTTIAFPETVKEIGARAFSGCKWLREVQGAENVASIGAHAFSGCVALRSMGPTDGLRDIGARAFENCTSLERLYIPEGVEEIPERAFYRCHALTGIRLPSTLKRIGREAFAFCGGAHGLQVPTGIEVGERAFYGCADVQTGRRQETG